MLKFAKSKYATFENSSLNLRMYRGDVFAVTEEIEQSEVYQMGVATKNFVPVQVKNTVELGKIVNLTDEIRAEFMASIRPKVEVKEPEPERMPEPEIFEIPEPVVEDVPEESETEDEADEEVEPDVVYEDDIPMEDTISFTEEAGNVANAMEAISNETDIQKLNDALLLDERKSVKKAILKRIEELES